MIRKTETENSFVSKKVWLILTGWENGPIQHLISEEAATIFHYLLQLFSLMILRNTLYNTFLHCKNLAFCFYPFIMLLCFILLKICCYYMPFVLFNLKHFKPHLLSCKWLKRPGYHAWRHKLNHFKYIFIIKTMHLCLHL